MTPILLLGLLATNVSDERQSLQANLKTFYEGIRSAHLKYTGRWTPNKEPPKPKFLFEEWRGCVKTGSQELPAVELWWAYPKMRGDFKDRRQSGETTATNVESFILANNRRLIFNHQTKGLDDSAADGLGRLDVTPFIGIGIRMRGTLNTSFANLASLEGIVSTTSLSHGVRLGVGPRIPSYICSGWFKQTGTATFLFTDESRPLPAEVQLAYPLRNDEGFQTDQYRLSDFRPIRDQATSKEVRLPFRIEYRNEVGTKTWEISEFAVNEPIQDEVFGISPALATGVVRDGKSQPRTTATTPKTPEPSKQLTTDVILSEPIPSAHEAATSWPALWWLLGVPALCGMAMVSIWGIKRYG